jgi:type I pantothenate kinase
MIDGPGALLEIIHSRARDDGHATVVALAGAVAVGKTTFAASVAARGRAEGTSVEVVGTDGFLRPNAWLVAHGLLDRKGFPETYDVEALRELVARVHQGAPRISVPVYSHVTYDIEPGEQRRIDDANVVIVEGLNALSALAGRVELAVYLEAPDDAVESWYLERFHRLCADAVDDEASFYRTFTGMAREDVHTIAQSVWRDVNAVNNREHVEPTRAHADCVIMKGRGHEVVSIELREHDRAGDQGG